MAAWVPFSEGEIFLNEAALSGCEPMLALQGQLRMQITIHRRLLLLPGVCPGEQPIAFAGPQPSALGFVPRWCDAVVEA